MTPQRRIRLLIRLILAMAACQIATGALAVAGHLWQIPLLYEWAGPQYIGMALNTGILFICTGVAQYALTTAIHTLHRSEEPGHDD